MSPEKVSEIRKNFDSYIDERLKSVRIEDDRDELKQQVYQRLLEGRYPKSCYNDKALLLEICRNLISNYRTERKHLHANPTLSDLESDADKGLISAIEAQVAILKIDTRPSESQIRHMAELYERVTADIEHDELSILLDVAVKGRKKRDIGEEYGLTIGQVDHVLRRVRAQLRAKEPTMNWTAIAAAIESTPDLGSSERIDQALEKAKRKHGLGGSGGVKGAILMLIGLSSLAACIVAAIYLPGVSHALSNHSPTSVEPTIESPIASSTASKHEPNEAPIDQNSEKLKPESRAGVESTGLRTLNVQPHGRQLPEPASPFHEWGALDQVEGKEVIWCLLYRRDSEEPSLAFAWQVLTSDFHTKHGLMHAFKADGTTLKRASEFRNGAPCGRREVYRDNSISEITDR